MTVCSPAVSKSTEVMKAQSGQNLPPQAVDMTALQSGNSHSLLKKVQSSENLNLYFSLILFILLFEV